ncbi:syndecan-4-like [Myxocyprinus asiaticus]|uniref:syndecan-4-like n=1 Tax=Myxocyprinus asiaticus TaxID=70543 RepID=UPI002223AF7A|nr:syndecan-4-like [Myxocyprinus asiaticus]
MLKVYLMLVLSAVAVFAESVREMETWVPLENKLSFEDLESSGDSTNRDFEFTDINPTTDDEDGFDEDDSDDYDDMSGSGDTAFTPDKENEVIDNMIPDRERPVPPKPTINDEVLIKNNEVALGKLPNQDDSQTSNVHMSHAGDESFFNNTEVLVAVIAGAAVGLIFAIFLIILLVYFVLRIKKKDEGSYDLGKTPIYKKAPTTEIYA